MNPDWLNLLLALGGAGGLGSVIITALSNKGMNHAKETMTLAEGYEKRLAVLTSRICDLEANQVILKDEIQKFKGLLDDREDMIEILQKENTELKQEVETLRVAVKSRDERIKVLESRVEALTLRLNSMKGGVE